TAGNVLRSRQRSRVLQIDEREHVVMLLRADLEDAAHEKALDPRANADSGNRLLASFRGGYQHGDLIADTRVDRIGQTDAEHDVLRTRLQVVEPSAQHVVRDFRYLRLELGIDSTNRRGAQLVSAAEH